MASKLSKVNLNDYKPLREVIFDTLREAIIMGELKPGERLMEVQLAEKMGVSRTPVREAIRKLELEGFVTMVPRRGVQVADLSMKDIIDVLEIRASLDSLATSLAAERITNDELKDLKHVNNQFTNYVEKENLQNSIKKDVEFHELIYRCSRNEKLLQITNNLREQVHRFRVIYMKDLSAHKGLVAEHCEILEAIEARDPERAGMLARKHIENQEQAILNSIHKNNL
ncbi:GntR family transcriptional regulator [Clostridium thermosuccinogenes]|jgi:DNA-binding GntR family transcriptional regulator|uniref:GntR family transcriptional regulator n=1 Tax=Clostridium thermosuccinogenes TaxID=84032 RepID=A0A2K2EWH1_9CLOT|nr:GntR family transcriptional regulator [Pseudoclostridium thermosuccinogenes]AUS98465.1 GntR family transcriptional regulator [Pseudoclostridium thermosuccinogenes]PNT90869.1 GntR family transcriptional regulator [Pseudoclostridium thermosuccinogenes]PNT97082.1 GntR family transcriptional regulator [Pseudoclostridium thermosuccinogenes]PNT99013.1 GntR family transcriptional regulator [Pseudoclostridium thermosuccinogenes]